MRSEPLLLVQTLGIVQWSLGYAGEDSRGVQSGPVVPRLYLIKGTGKLTFVSSVRNSAGQQVKPDFVGNRHGVSEWWRKSSISYPRSVANQNLR